MFLKSILLAVAVAHATLDVAAAMIGNDHRQQQVKISSLEYAKLFPGSAESKDGS